MKRLMSLFLALAVCSAALCTAAAAAEEAAEEPVPAFVRVWGKVSPWDGEGIYLKNDEDNGLSEVVIHPGDAPAVDASTGLPLDLETVKEGDTLYVWSTPVMALSMPPQMGALAIVGNVPEGQEAPEFCEVAQHVWRFAPEDQKNPVLNLAGGGVWHTQGEQLELTDKTVYTPWLTKQIVGMDDLVPGTRMLVWKDENGAAEKIQLLPSVYQGYVCVFAAMGSMPIAVNGGFDAERDQDTPQFNGKRTENGTAAPIRGIAEAAGYEVRWDKALGAVVSLNGETVFSVLPGKDVAVTPEGEVALSAPCLKEAGTTYLPLEDLCGLLNLYLALG